MLKAVVEEEGQYETSTYRKRERKRWASPDQEIDSDNRFVSPCGRSEKS